MHVSDGIKHHGKRQVKPPLIRKVELISIGDYET